MATAREFRPDIQGLRAIAVLAVVLYHAGLPFLPGGYIGVDIFFVISGFLITSHLLGGLARDGRVKFASFYARRARRILPASFVVVILTVAAAVLWYPPLLMKEVWQGAIATALYVPNMLFAVNGTDYLAEATPSLFQHYWSLGVEEQFYLIWPLLLALGWRFVRSRRALFACLIALVVLSFAGGVVFTYLSQPWAFFSLPTRAWELGVGGIVAFAVLHGRRTLLGARSAATLGWIGMAGIVGSIVLFTEETPFPSYWAAIPVAATALVIFAGATPSRVGPTAVLSFSLMQFLGLISYSLYLVHWPALMIPDMALGGSPLWLSVLIAVGCVPLAWLMYRFVETPGRSMPLLSRARPARTLWLSLVSSVAIIALASGAFLYSRSVPLHAGEAAVAAVPLTVDPEGTDFVPSNLSPSLRSAADDQPVIYADGCHLSYSGVEPQDCAYGDPAGREIALFGDSHAAQWFPALENYAEAKGYRLQVYTKSACPAAGVEILRDSVPFTQCDEWRARTIEQLNIDDPELVVVSDYSSSVFDYAGASRSDAWQTGLEDTLRAIDTQTVIFADTAHTARSTGVCLSAHLTEADDCSVDINTGFDKDVRRAEADAAADAGAQIVDFNRYICGPDECPAVIGNLLVYRDEHHLTATFVDEQLSAPVAQAIDRILDSPDMSGGE